MKNIKKVILVIIAGMLVMGSTAFYQITQINDNDPSIEVYTFNDQPVTYQHAVIQHDLLGFIPYEKKVDQDDIIRYETNQIQNELTVSDMTQVTITAPDQSTQSFTGSKTLSKWMTVLRMALRSTMCFSSRF